MGEPRPSQSPSVTALPEGEPRGYFLPLPLGEVAERSEDGEGKDGEGRDANVTCVRVSQANAILNVL